VAAVVVEAVRRVLAAVVVRVFAVFVVALAALVLAASTVGVTTPPCTSDWVPLFPPPVVW
jgi:hypothetical protein